MTYAILEVSSKQFIIKKGDKILIDYIKNSENKQTLTFTSVLLINDNEINIIGKPYLNKVEIKATILKSCLKNKKIRVFKKKRRKGYQKTIGHKQKYTHIEINDIIKL